VGLYKAGIELETLDGYGNVSKIRQTLQRLRREQRFPYVVIDFESDGLRQLRRYANDGLLPAEFKHWETDFEEENFSTGELVRVANALARQSGAKVRVTVREVHDRRQANLAKGTDKRIVGLISECFGPEFNFKEQKGAQWGTALADWALDHHPPPTHRDEHGQRPIIGVLQFLLRASYADYLGTVQGMMPTETGELTKRPPAPSQ
ncbi:MAG: hypothetical protein WBD55_08845, partial [Dehalococcoidia bacterium]